MTLLLILGAIGCFLVGMLMGIAIGARGGPPSDGGGGDGGASFVTGMILGQIIEPGGPL